MDFVLYGERGLIGIEVKLSEKIKKEDLKSLLEFKSDYPMAKGFLLYGGSVRHRIDGIDLIPIVEFLTGMNEFCG